MNNCTLTATYSPYQIPIVTVYKYSLMLFLMLFLPLLNKLLFKSLIKMLIKLFKEAFTRR